MFYTLYGTRFRVFFFIFSDIVILLSLFAGPRSAVGSASDSRARGPGFDTQSCHILSFLFPLTSPVVSHWQKYAHEVLVNRLGGLSLPR